MELIGEASTELKGNNPNYIHVLFATRVKHKFKATLNLLHNILQQIQPL